MNQLDQQSPPLAAHEPVISPVGAKIDLADPSSPLARYYLSASQVVAVGLLGLVFVVTSAFPLWHTDIWGHMKFGQWILEQGRLPEHEPFCPWSDHEKEFSQFYTLSQTGFYLIYRLGGWLAGGDEAAQMAGGVEMLRLALAVLTVLWLALLLAAFRRLSGSLPVALAGVGAVLLLDASSLPIIRPQVFGQVFFAALLVALSRPVLSRRALVGLPLLLAVWANSHGSYIVGLGFLGICLVGRCLEARGGGGSAGRAFWADLPVRRLALATAASTLAVAFLNPHGPALFARTFQVTRDPALLGFVSEWQPLTFWRVDDDGRTDWRALPLLVSLAALTATQLASPRRFSATQVLVVASFGLACALQTRMLIWWGMLAPWVMVPHWAAASGACPLAWLHHQSVPSLRKTALAGLILLAVLMWSPLVGWALAGRPRALASALSAGTPWELARELPTTRGRPGPLVTPTGTGPGRELPRRPVPGGHSGQPHARRLSHVGPGPPGPRNLYPHASLSRFVLGRARGCGPRGYGLAGHPGSIPGQPARR